MAFGVAVKMALPPVATRAEQVPVPGEVQLALAAAPVLVTVPLPPKNPTNTSYAERAKLAVTLFTAFPSTLQAPVPVQAPDQPVKTEFAPAATVTATVVPVGMPAVQEPWAVVQSTCGTTATETVPVAPFVPVGFTVSGQVAGGKVAVTERLPVRLVRTQVPATTELQPTHVGAAVFAPVTAYSVKLAGVVNVALQMLPVLQVMAGATEVTWPEAPPPPDLALTVIVAACALDAAVRATAKAASLMRVTVMNPSKRSGPGSTTELHHGAVPRQALPCTRRVP
jgi:hypothetical protein